MHSRIAMAVKFYALLWTGFCCLQSRDQKFMAAATPAGYSPIHVLAVTCPVGGVVCGQFKFTNYCRARFQHPPAASRYNVLGNLGI